MINKTSGIEKWQLPLIDHDLTGADKHKLSVYSGFLNTRLADSFPTKSALDLTDILPSVEITNDIYESDPDGDGTNTGNNRILIATKNLADGNISIYEFDNSLTLQATNPAVDHRNDLFTNSDITDIKLKISQNATNPAAYLMGRNDSGAFAYARINHTAGNFDQSIAGVKVVLDLDNAFDLFDSSNTSYYDISPGAEQYQLFMAAVDKTLNDAFLVTIAGNNPVVDCSYNSDQDLQYCMKLTANRDTSGTADNVFDLPVALGDVLEGVTIGSAGATASENTNNVLPVVFHIDENGTGGSPTSDAIPMTGLLNVSGIDLTGDNTSYGQKHNIPYVNN